MLKVHQIQGCHPKVLSNTLKCTQLLQVLISALSPLQAPIGPLTPPKPVFKGLGGRSWESETSKAGIPH